MKWVDFPVGHEEEVIIFLLFLDIPIRALYRTLIVAIATFGDWLDFGLRLLERVTGMTT